MTIPQNSAAALLVAGQHVARAVEQRLQAESLSANEALLLTELLSAGPMTMNAVRQSLVIEKSTATSLVDRLQRRGIIERRPNPSDGRSLLVQLSRSGQRLARKTAAAFDAVDSDLTQVSESALRGHRQVMQRTPGLTTA